MVGAESRFAFLAIDKGVAESRDVARSFPSLWMEQDWPIHPYHVFAHVDKRLPPQITYIFFEFGAVRAVAVGVGEAAVDFRARIDKTSSFR